MRNFVHFLLITAVALPLMGCDQTRQAFGLNRKYLDEFQVQDRAPLSQPPGYALRPPQPGAKGKATIDTQAKVKSALKIKESKAPRSKAEKNLLALAQTSQNDKDIRTKLSKETPKKAEKAPGESLVFWKNKKGSSGGDVIDPEEENRKYNSQATTDSPEAA